MKGTSPKAFAFAVVATVLFITGCSKSGTSAQNVGQSSPSTQAQDNQQTPAAAPLPTANVDTPLAQYVTLADGKQLMFLYLAASTTQLDYEKVATAYSSKYGSTSDAFKKKDLMEQLKPEIDSEIAKAKASRYFYVEYDAHLNSYDFKAKGFSITNNMLQDRIAAYSWDHRSADTPDNLSYFDDNNFALLGFGNHNDFNFLKVADEAKARQIEDLNQKSSLKLVIYAFARQADTDHHYLKAQIVKIKLMDNKGNELLVQ